MQVCAYVAQGKRWRKQGSGRERNRKCVRVCDLDKKVGKTGYGEID